MKKFKILLLAVFILSFNAFSETEIKGSTKNNICISTNKLQNIYAQIYKINSDQEEYYYKLRTESIYENFNYLSSLKKLDRHEFNQLRDDRKKHLYSCSGILDKSFCLYKLNLKNQINIISDIVERGGEVKEAIIQLESTKESDYYSLKKYKKF